MARKVKKIYQALIEGATEGHSGDGLFRYIKANCPKATSKRIVKASLLALTDPAVKDASVLRVVYALAIRHRLDALEKYDLEPEAEGTAAGQPD